MRTVGRLLDAHPERARDFLGDRRARGVGIELQGAADEVSGVDVAEHHIGVGHRRLGAALAVADWPWHRAGAVRPDLQRATTVDPQDRSAAGSDLREIDRWHLT